MRPILDMNCLDDILGGRLDSHFKSHTCRVRVRVRVGVRVKVRVRRLDAHFKSKTCPFR